MAKGRRTKGSGRNQLKAQIVAIDVGRKKKGRRRDHRILSTNGPLFLAQATLELSLCCPGEHGWVVTR